MNDDDTYQTQNNGNDFPFQIYNMLPNSIYFQDNNPISYICLLRHNFFMVSVLPNILTCPIITYIYIYIPECQCDPISQVEVVGVG